MPRFSPQVHGGVMDLDVQELETKGNTLKDILRVCLKSFEFE